MDPNGKVRKITRVSGFEDGGLTTTYYYDASGRLRFLFQLTDSAPANGSLTRTELRSYFDPQGKRIWDAVRTATNPSGNDPDMSKAAFQHPDADNVDPVDADHVSNPAVAFDAPPTCF